MKRFLSRALALLILAGCLPEEIEVDTSSTFHLCETKQGADELLRSALNDNYFLMIGSINDKATRLKCPAYRMHARISVTVLSTDLIPRGQFSKLVFAEINDSKLGTRYTSYLVNRRTQIASGAIVQIVEQRTENGINDFLNEAFK